VGVKRLREEGMERRVERGRRERGDRGGRRGRMRWDFYRVDAGAFVRRRDGNGNLLRSGLGRRGGFDRAGFGALLG